MNLFGNDLHSSSSKSFEEDIVIKKILLTHDPDDHRRLDSQLLLTAIENVMRYSTASDVRIFDVDAIAKNDISNVHVVGAEEPLGLISRISNEMLFKSLGEGDLHTKTMILFDILAKYRWDAKLVLILAAFATKYGELWLLIQQHPYNPLAVSVAQLKQLPNDLIKLKPMFKALTLLIKTIVDVTKCIIKFESLPFRHVKLDDQAMSTAKSCIYIASYWVTKSILACSSQITDLIGMKPELSACSFPSNQQINMHLNSAAWQLTSLAYRLSSIFIGLSRQVDLCHQQIETKLYQKLLSLFQEAHPDNQEILGILLALKDELPLKKSSTQAKVYILIRLSGTKAKFAPKALKLLNLSELKGKIVILLISKPDLLPLEGLLLLVHQTYDHPHHKKLEGSYEIVWVPISLSGTWTHAEVETFNFLSNSLPWGSIRWPWSLNSTVVKYIKQTWDFKNDPVMVVLDSQGNITNSNAIDMCLIWGAKAYPFSVPRETELWKEENWSIRFLLNELDPLLTRSVEENRNICIYGSDNLDWIRDFDDKIKDIKGDGVQLEMVYVGKRNLNLDSFNEEIHTSLLPVTKIEFFWLRLESMQRSIHRLEQSIGCDHIKEELQALLDSTDEGWAIIGREKTSDIVKLRGRKSIECLNKYTEWRENVPELGFIGALRNASEPTPPLEPCNHSNVLPYAEELFEGIVLCEMCKRPMKKYVVYE